MLLCLRGNVFNFLLISRLVQALVASQGQESFFCFRISVGDFKDSLSVSTKNMKNSSGTCVFRTVWHNSWVWWSTVLAHLRYSMEDVLFSVKKSCQFIRVIKRDSLPTSNTARLLSVNTFSYWLISCNPLPSISVAWETWPSLYLPMLDWQAEWYLPFSDQRTELTVLRKSIHIHVGSPENFLNWILIFLVSEGERNIHLGSLSCTIFVHLLW